MKNFTEEHKGEAFIIFNTIFWGLSPVILRGSEGIVPPLFFAGITQILSGLFFLTLLVKRKEIDKLFNLQFLKYQFSALIIFAPWWYFLILAGQKSLPGNMSILFQSGVFFSFLFFGLLKMETFSSKRIIGAILIVLGSSMVIIGEGKIGRLISWDILVLFVAAMMVIGSYFGQRAIKYSSISSVLSFNLILGTIIIIFSFFIEKSSFNLLSNSSILFYIIVYTVIIAIINNYLWFEGIKRIDISKAVSLDGLAPIFTMIFAFVFLNVLPTWEQILGFIIVFPGVLLIVKKRKKIQGTVIKGRGIGKKIGFPTLNFEAKNLPSYLEGVFVGELKFFSKSNPSTCHFQKAAIFIGKPKTFNIKQKTFEVHILDFDQDIKVGTKAEVKIAKKIRNTKKFNKVSALIKQIKRDCKEVGKILS